MDNEQNTISLTPADPQLHLMAIARMTSDAFAGGEYVEEISQQYIGNCHYDWDTSRLVWDGDRLVHHWGVWGYPMRLETVKVKVAGVGAVVTDEAYRQRGLMAMAATDSLKAMGKNGYDLSILRGRHYVKYGYVRAWNYITYRLKAEDVPTIELISAYRLIGPDKMDELIDVYNRYYSSFSGTCVRPTYRMLSTEDMQVYGWFDKTGRLKGYVRAVPTEDKKHLQCLEATGDPQQGLAVLGELFRQGEYESMTFFTIPHQHPILQILRRGACVVENQYFHNTGWRVRIVNLSSTLGKLRPLLNKRLRRSRYANWQGGLRLDCGEQKATLQIEAGQVLFIDSARSEHNIRGGWQIARLLIGSDEPGEVIQQSGISCTGEADGLVGVLFPNLYPVMSHWDEY